MLSDACAVENEARGQKARILLQRSLRLCRKVSPIGPTRRLKASYLSSSQEEPLRKKHRSRKKHDTTDSDSKSSGSDSD